MYLDLEIIERETYLAMARNLAVYLFIRDDLACSGYWNTVEKNIFISSYREFLKAMTTHDNLREARKANTKKGHVYTAEETIGYRRRCIHRFRYELVLNKRLQGMVRSCEKRLLEKESSGQSVPLCSTKTIYKDFPSMFLQQTEEYQPLTVLCRVIHDHYDLNLDHEYRKYHYGLYLEEHDLVSNEQLWQIQDAPLNYFPGANNFYISSCETRFIPPPPRSPVPVSVADRRARLNKFKIKTRSKGTNLEMNPLDKQAERIPCQQSPVQEIENEFEADLAAGMHEEEDVYIPDFQESLDLFPWEDFPKPAFSTGPESDNVLLTKDASSVELTPATPAYATYSAVENFPVQPTAIEISTVEIAPFVQLSTELATVENAPVVAESMDSPTVERTPVFRLQESPTVENAPVVAESMDSPAVERTPVFRLQESPTVENAPVVAEFMDSPAVERTPVFRLQESPTVENAPVVAESMDSSTVERTPVFRLQELPTVENTPVASSTPPGSSTVEPAPVTTTAVVTQSVKAYSTVVTKPVNPSQFSPAVRASMIKPTLVVRSQAQIWRADASQKHESGHQLVGTDRPHVYENRKRRLQHSGRENSGDMDQFDRGSMAAKRLKVVEDLKLKRMRMTSWLNDLSDKIHKQSTSVFKKQQKRKREVMNTSEYFKRANKCAKLSPLVATTAPEIVPKARVVTRAAEKPRLVLRIHKDTSDTWTTTPVRGTSGKRSS